MVSLLILSIICGSIATAIMAYQHIGPFAPQPCPPPPVVLPPGVERLEIPASGLEVFSSVLSVGRVYELMFQGTCSMSGSRLFGGVFYFTADSAYSTDSVSNFSVPHSLLLVDQRSIRELDHYQEDRALHEYRTRIEGCGKRVFFRLKSSAPDKSFLTVVITPLPWGTIGPTAAKRAEADKLAREKAAAAQAAAAQARQHEEQLRLAAQASLIAQMKRYVHLHRNFFDAEFRREYIWKSGPSLLSELGQAWTKEYNALFDNHELVAALKTAGPEVLEFHEHRLAMIAEAERAAVIPVKIPAPPPPPPAPAPPPLPKRQITATTMGHVSNCIRQLFEFTEMYDRESQALALDKNQRAHEEKLARAIAGMAFCYKHLRLFGIDADTPETAEMQFFRLCPPPAPTVYEELIRKLKKRKAVPPDALCERLEDLHREKIILQARRRASIRRDDDCERNKLDQRLAEVRVEATEIKAFLEAINVPVDFKDHNQREQELSLEEKLLRLRDGRKRVIDYLTAEGDEQAVEQVDALYAQEQAKLFGQDSDSSY